MSETIRRAIEDMQGILAAKMAEVSKLKATINSMAQTIGDSPPYEDNAVAQQTDAVPRRSQEVKPDEFFGKTPITAARLYLERVHEPLTAEAILDALTRGGFNFAEQGWKEEKQRLRNLAISLGKNTSIFVRLPSGPYGLVKWYPELKRRAKSESGKTPSSAGTAVAPSVADAASESSTESVADDETELASEPTA